MNASAVNGDPAAVRQGTDLSRRKFLQAGSGLLLAIALPASLGVAAAETNPTTLEPVNAWLQIGTDDSIVLTIGSSDMGQGSFSGLAQILAEDLMVDYARIQTVQGRPTLVSPAPVGNAINTVSSGVTRGNFWRLRDAAAAAREMLVMAAMQHMADGERANYAVTDGVITHVPSGQRIGYGALAEAAAKFIPPLGAALVPDDQLKVIGKSLRRTDIPAKIDGSARYGIDVQLPGMLYAVIKHCPTLGGKLATKPATPAGMTALVPIAVTPGNGRGAEAAGNVNAVAVVGPNTWDTLRAARALRVSWTLPSNASVLNSTQFASDAQALASAASPFVAGATNPPGTLYTAEGDAIATRDALTRAARTVEATYSLPYVAHGCMEVLNCTVDFVPDVKCEIYAPTQSARAALSLATTMTGLPESKVTIHATLLGGGLGRKAEVDFIGQALQVASAVQKPVKLMWSREEDFTHDQYRPMALVRARAALDAVGTIAGWSYRNVSPSILAQRGATLGAKGDSQATEGSLALPYALGPRVVEYVSHPAPVPVGFWRSVGASINTFAVESLIDELASAAGEDAYTFRRRHLTDQRWVAVLDAAADLAGWRSPPPAGRARGIAIGTAFNSIVAEVVEISAVTSSSVRIERVSVAIDCYLVVNPQSVEAQLVGGVVHGINSALYGRQTFSNGVAQVSNFNRSRVIRLSEMPKVQVTIMPNPAVADRSVAIGGVGELGVPTLAPALANACFAMTGKRVRDLPLFPNATMGD